MLQLRGFSFSEFAAAVLAAGDARARRPRKTRAGCSLAWRASSRYGESFPCCFQWSLCLFGRARRKIFGAGGKLAVNNPTHVSCMHNTNAHHTNGIWCQRWFFPLSLFAAHESVSRQWRGHSTATCSGSQLDEVCVLCVCNPSPYAHHTCSKDSRDGEKEAIVPYHTREHLVKKLRYKPTLSPPNDTCVCGNPMRMLYCHREMKEDPQMLELVLPECLGEEEVACAGEVARELGLKTEKVNHTVLCCKCTLSKLCGVFLCRIHSVG